MAGTITPRFLDPLDLRKAGPGQWELLHEFRFDSAVLGARLIVKQGFVTDLASVPRFVPLAFALAGESAEAAAVLHDWGYRIKLFPRAQVDALFLEAMETDGTLVGIPPEPRWRSWLMWAGVRAGGWLPWGREPAIT